MPVPMNEYRGELKQLPLWGGIRLDLDPPTPGGEHEAVLPTRFFPTVPSMLGAEQREFKPEPPGGLVLAGIWPATCDHY
jgi:hypothetical protein